MDIMYNFFHIKLSLKFNNVLLRCAIHVVCLNYKVR